MRSWGITLIVLAVLSKVLPQFGVQLFVMMWVDQWGATIGWIIRAVVAAVGLGLIIASHTKPRA